MIAEQYIQEGIRLRREYLKNLKEIIKQEPIIFSRKKNFEELKVEMENIAFSEMNDFRKTIELNNKLITLEKEMNKIQNMIRPFYDNIEKLKTERDRLYLAIKEKYPNISNEQIEKEIMIRVEE